MTKNRQRKKCTSFTGHFDGHADQVIQCHRHHPVWQGLGYSTFYWAPASGGYSTRIALTDAIVIDFGVKNQVVAL
jgi:hypothetical protein